MLGAAATVIIIYFAVLNPHKVDFFWSSSHEEITIPFFAIILVVFVSGYIIGTFYTWLSLLPKHLAQRKTIRKQTKTIENLEEELEETGHDQSHGTNDDTPHLLRD
jgi:uncharacterized integral membrane protein